MTYELEIEPQAVEDIEFHKKSGNMAVINKISALLSELMEHPETGTGKPERLKNELSGRWSRRINHHHRMVYSINDNTVTVSVISALGHY